MFGKNHHPGDLNQVCSNYAPKWAKNGPAPGITCFTLAYKGLTLKIFLSVTTKPRALLFGM